MAGSTWRVADEGLRLVMPGAAVVFLIAAWRLARAGRDTGAVVLLLAASLLFRVFAAGDLYLHEWDERYHALVAKHLIQDPLRPTLYAEPVLDYDYRSWTRNHVWLHKPPLALWLMALAMMLAGVSEIAARVPSVALSTLSVALTFLTGRVLFGPTVALVAAALQGMNGLLLDLAAGRRTSDHVDTTLLFFVSLGGYAIGLDLVRPRWRTIVAIGLCTGCAFLTKSYVALLIPALWLTTAVGQQAPAVMAGRLLVLLGVAAALAAPWHLHVASRFAREAAWESQYTWRHLGHVIEHHGQPVYYYLQRLGRDYGELTYVPLVWFIAAIGARWRRPEQRFLLVWLLLPLVVFSAAATKLPGYLVVSAPAIFLIEGLFVRRACDWLADPRPSAGGAPSSLPWWRSCSCCRCAIRENGSSSRRRRGAARCGPSACARSTPASDRGRLWCSGAHARSRPCSTARTPPTRGRLGPTPSRASWRAATASSSWGTPTGARRRRTRAPRSSSPPRSRWEAGARAGPGRRRRAGLASHDGCAPLVVDAREVRLKAQRPTGGCVRALRRPAAQARSHHRACAAAARGPAARDAGAAPARGAPRDCAGGYARSSRDR